MIWAAHILNPACQVFLEGSSLLKHHTLLQAVEEINIKKIHQKDKIVFLIDRLQWFFLPGLGQTQRGMEGKGLGHATHLSCYNPSQLKPSACIPFLFFY